MMMNQYRNALAILLAGASPAALAQTAPAETAPAPVIAVPPPPMRLAPPPPPPPMMPRPAQDTRKPVVEKGNFLSREEWPRCDGLTPPMRNSDGMIRKVDLMVNFTPNRSTPRFGKMGVEVCDLALADPRMKPEMTLRRAHILQARALHKAAARDLKGALADLDSSDAALGDDRYALRSIGANNRLLRAWVQIEDGAKEDAARTTREAVALRPWEPAYRAAAIQLHLAATGEWERFAEDSRDLAKLDPNRLVRLFHLAMIRGEFETAAALHPQINLTLPRDRGGFQISNLLIGRVRQMQERMALRGAYAYALAATGKSEQALAQIAEARTELEAQLAPPKPIGRRTEPTREQLTEHNMFTIGAPRARAELDRWERLLRLRNMISKRDYQGALVELERSPVGTDGAVLDILTSLNAIMPTPSPKLTERATAMKADLAAALEQARRIDLRDLYETLPEPERANTVPPYDGGKDGFFSFDTDGYRTDPSQVAGAQTIRFARDDGTMAMASEMVLLRAAELARKQGQGLVLVGRRSLSRELRTYTQLPGTGTPAGYEAELDIMFVDPAKLPPEMAESGWRVLDPNAIWDALSPLYPPPARRTVARN